MGRATVAKLLDDLERKDKTRIKLNKNGEEQLQDCRHDPVIPLLLPTLFGKMGIFTCSPLLWVKPTAP